MVNDGHVVDIAALGAGTGGGDTAVETKVPQPLKKQRAAGIGTRQHGGCPATVGNLYAFGSNGGGVHAPNPLLQRARVGRHRRAV